MPIICQGPVSLALSTAAQAQYVLLSFPFVSPRYLTVVLQHTSTPNLLLYFLHCLDASIGFDILQANAAHYAAATMRCAARIAIGASILLFIPLWLLKNHLEDIWTQYDVPAYVFSAYKSSSLAGEGYATPHHKRPSANNSSDKVIVMAKLELEDTDWVAEELPE